MRATARRASPQAFDDYDEEEPTTRLSSAFIVVLVLHLVAVGGIYRLQRHQGAPRKARKSCAGPAPAQTRLPSRPQPPCESRRRLRRRRATPRARCAPRTPRPRRSPAARVHHVQSRRTLSKIAFAYSVTAARARECQRPEGRPPSCTRARSLNIPAPHTAAKPRRRRLDKTTPKQETLADLRTTPRPTPCGKGETPSAIARKLGVSTRN